jgi:putative CocE/NonD family hydrolase
MFSGGMIRPLAERGFQVILQSARGTFGSGGTFQPMRNEREDGLATLDWVVKQPWFGDSIVLVGPSYMGYVQWAVADRLPPEVKAMIPQITESRPAGALGTVRRADARARHAAGARAMKLGDRKLGDRTSSARTRSRWRRRSAGAS